MHTDSVVNVIQIAIIHSFGIDSKRSSIDPNALNGVVVVSYGLRGDRTLGAKLGIYLGVKTPH